MKWTFLLVFCIVIVGVGTYNVTTTLPPPQVVYVSAEGDFDSVSIYTRGDSRDVLRTTIFDDGGEEWFDNTLSNHRVFKVFVVIDGISYGPREINLVEGITTSVEEMNVTINIWEDLAPQGYIRGLELLSICFVGVLGGVGLWLLIFIPWAMTDNWRYNNGRMYGFEMRQDPGFRRPREMPIKGRWWVRMINIKLGREKEEVVE